MNIWNVLVSKLWKWYKGHDGVADAHHAPYTDIKARDAMGDLTNPLNLMYFDSGDLGAVGNIPYRLQMEPTSRNQLNLVNTTNGWFGNIRIGFFTAYSFYLDYAGMIQRWGTNPEGMYTKYIDGGSGQVVLSNIGSIEFIQDALLKDLKNHTASALSGTKKLIEIDISGTPYYFEVYPTKA